MLWDAAIQLWSKKRDTTEEWGKSRQAILPCVFKKTTFPDDLWETWDHLGIISVVVSFSCQPDIINLGKGDRSLCHCPPSPPPSVRPQPQASARVWFYATTPSSYMGSGDLNLCLHAFKALFPLSPETPQLFLKWILGICSGPPSWKESPFLTTPLQAFHLPLLSFRDSHSSGTAPPPPSAPFSLRPIFLLWIHLVTLTTLLSDASSHVGLMARSNAGSATHKAPIKWAWEI